MAPSANFTYRLELADGRAFEFAVDTEGQATAPVDPPSWTRLDTCQCPNCPLEPASYPHCPTALALVPVIRAFETVDSVTQVRTRVTSHLRVVEAQTDVQTALRSLIGLIMPTSGCPILERLRGLAKFHLPFSDKDETVFRVMGAFLLEQYLVAQAGGDPDWNLDGMRALYRDLLEVDMAFAQRMRMAVSADASVNAVVALFSLATLVSISLDEELLGVRDRLQSGS